jgi:hypothetical protein
MAKTTRRPQLKMRKVAHKRTSYSVRSGLASRAAGSLLAAVNGRGEASWSHETIRAAIQRQTAIELEDLEVELPHAAISYAVTKGWLYRSQAAQTFLRVTRRAALDLELPAKQGNGQKVAFLDTAALPPSLPAFDAPKPRAETTAERAAAIVAEILQPRSAQAEIKLLQAVIAETGWAPKAIAERIGGADVKLVNAWWNRAIMMLAIADDETASEAARQVVTAIPKTRRPELAAALQAGRLDTWAKIQRFAKRLSAAQ